MKKIPGKEKYQLGIEVETSLAEWVRVTAAKKGISMAEFIRGLIYGAKRDTERDSFADHG